MLFKKILFTSRYHLLFALVFVKSSSLVPAQAPCVPDAYFSYNFPVPAPCPYPQFPFPYCDPEALLQTIGNLEDLLAKTQQHADYNIHTQQKEIKHLRRLLAWHRYQLAKKSARATPVPDGEGPGIAQSFVAVQSELPEEDDDAFRTPEQSQVSTPASSHCSTPCPDSKMPDIVTSPTPLPHPAATPDLSATGAFVTSKRHSRRRRHPRNQERTTHQHHAIASTNAPAPVIIETAGEQPVLALSPEEKAALQAQLKAAQDLAKEKGRERKRQEAADKERQKLWFANVKAHCTQQNLGAAWAQLVPLDRTASDYRTGLIMVIDAAHAKPELLPEDCVEAVGELLDAKRADHTAVLHQTSDRKKALSVVLAHTHNAAVKARLQKELDALNPQAANALQAPIAKKIPPVPSHASAGSDRFKQSSDTLQILLAAENFNRAQALARDYYQNDTDTRAVNTRFKRCRDELTKLVDHSTLFNHVEFFMRVIELVDCYLGQLSDRQIQQLRDLFTKIPNLKDESDTSACRALAVELQKNFELLLHPLVIRVKTCDRRDAQTQANQGERTHLINDELIPLLGDIRTKDDMCRFIYSIQTSQNPHFTSTASRILYSFVDGMQEGKVKVLWQEQFPLEVYIYFLQTVTYNELLTPLRAKMQSYGPTLLAKIVDQETSQGNGITRFKETIEIYSEEDVRLFVYYIKQAVVKALGDLEQSHLIKRLNQGAQQELLAYCQTSGGSQCAIL